MQIEFEEDRYFNFGSCNYLPSDYVEAVKDTIRGVLVEYYFQTSPQIGSSTMSMARKQKGITRTRGVLGRELEEHKFQRALGLVTITRTTTKWRTSRMDSSYYLETRIQVYLDPAPETDLSSRFRLFCISNFDGTPRYEPRFDPALRVSNRVRYNDPIVTACRNGDLDNVRMLFASGNASPYDCCEADKNISLLDIVFKQLMLNLDAPAASSKDMAKLCILFKYLVDLGLDPGELSIQLRHPASQDVYFSGRYVLRCSHCFKAIEGMYYDCKLCACGDFCLCRPCIEAGRRCQDPGHYEKQPLVDSSIQRWMLYYSPMESLASIYYAKENAPYLVDVARTILCRSKQDPFQECHGRLIEWKLYEKLADVDSPVLRLVSHQQEWVFQWDQTAPEVLSSVPLAWKPQDPAEFLLRAWLDIIEPSEISMDQVHTVFDHLSYLFDNDEVRETFHSRAANYINSNNWCINFQLWCWQYWPQRRPSLEGLLHRCIATRSIIGYRRIVSKYSPRKESPFTHQVISGNDEGEYYCAVLTRRFGKGGETKNGREDKLGICLLSDETGDPIIFYDGLLGGLWFGLLE
jgi:hypothetical protein